MQKANVIRAILAGKVSMLPGSFTVLVAARWEAHSGGQKMSPRDLGEGL